MLQLTIAGVDRTSRVIVGSIQAQQAITSQVDTLSFSLRLPPGSTSEIPDFTDEVILTNDGARVFAGLVIRTNPVLRRAPGELEVVVTAQDYQYQLTRRLVVEAWVSSSAGDIVRDIITDYASEFGITEGTIQAGPTIQEFRADYEQADDLITRVAEIAGFEWYIDYQRALHFFSPESAFPDAPWDLEVPAGPLAATAPVRGIRAPRDGTQYRNKITLRGSQSISDARTDQITATGVEREFTTKFPLVVPGSLTMDVGATPQTVGQKGVDDPDLFQWMVQYTGRDDLATITATDGTSTPSNGTVVSLTYRHFAQIIVEAQDDDGVLQRGVFEHIIIREEIDNRPLASQVAQAELQRWSRPADVIAFETTRPGLRAGMRLRVTAPQLGVNAEYLLRTVTLRYRAFAPAGLSSQDPGYAAEWSVEGERV